MIKKTLVLAAAMALAPWAYAIDKNTVSFTLTSDADFGNQAGVASFTAPPVTFDLNVSNELPSPYGTTRSTSTPTLTPGSSFLTQTVQMDYFKNLNPGVANLAHATGSVADNKIQLSVTGAQSTPYLSTGTGVGASAAWTGYFQLMPHQSFNFGGTYDIGTVHSTDLFGEGESIPGGYADHYAKAVGSNGMFSLNGTLYANALGQLGTVGYSYGDLQAGYMSVSFTNPNDTPILGRINFSLSTGANITSAVPEPEAYLSLMAGLGILGFVARRKKKAALSV